MEPDEWCVDYSNDVGNFDDYFVEWWEVTNGEVVFRSDSEQDANWLCSELNMRGKQKGH